LEFAFRAGGLCPGSRKSTQIGTDTTDQHGWRFVGNSLRRRASPRLAGGFSPTARAG